MAYVPQQLPENEQNQQAPLGTTTPNPIGNLPPVTTGGSSGQASGGTNPTGNGSNATSTQFGSDASKLSDYLSTNAPNIQKQGEQIAGQLSTGYNTTQTDINNAIGGFGTAVQGGYTANNPDLITQAANDPAKFAKDDSNVANFGKIWNDQYTGPQNIESTTPYQNVQNEVTNAVSNANLAQTPSGLQNYLKNTASGQYLPGMSTLDSALIQGNPESLGAIQRAAQPYAGLSDYLSGKVSTANAQVPAAQAAALAAKQAAQDAFTGKGGVNEKFKTDLDTRLSSATADRDKYNSLVSNVNSKIANGDTLTDEELASLNLDPEKKSNYDQQMQAIQDRTKNDTLTNSNLPDLSLSHYLNPGTLSQTAPTIAGIESASDAEKAKALATLTGADLTNYTNPSADYKLDHNLPTVDWDKLNMRITSAFNNIKAAQPPGYGVGPIGHTN